MIIQDLFGTIQNLQRALIPQTSNWSGTIFCCFLQQTGSTLMIVVQPDLDTAFSLKGYLNQFIREIRNSTVQGCCLWGCRGSDALHLFKALRLFKAICLFFLTNFPGPMFIPCPTSIMDSRVKALVHSSFCTTQQYYHLGLPTLCAP